MSATQYDPENLDVFKRLRKQGDTLTEVRPVSFSVVFPTEAAASDFSQSIRLQGYKVKFYGDGPIASLPWDVTVEANLIPGEESIGEFELMLERSASAGGGRNDGWFCQTIPDAPDYPVPEIVSSL